jgi:hypothetical protein
MDELDRRSTKSLVLFLVIICVIVIAIMMVPKFYTPKESETRYTYNYFEFQEKDGVWYSSVEYSGNLLQVALRNGPRTLEQVRVTGDITGFRDTYRSFYITFDPREDNHDRFVTMSNAEISPNMVVHFGKTVAPACSIPDAVCNESQVPVVTCESTSEGVVFLNRAPGPSVEIKGNCAIITGMGLDMVMAADRFMYGMYGIMR